MNTPKGIELLDATTRLQFDRSDDKTLLRRITQDVPSSFLDRLRDKRLASNNAPMGDLHHVASIPVAIVEKWITEGFNIYDKNVTIPEIMRRLQSESMEHLKATSKAI
jgi:hypothetical protein